MLHLKNYFQKWPPSFLLLLNPLCSTTTYPDSHNIRLLDPLSATRGTTRSVDMSHRSHSFLKTILQTSLVNRVRRRKVWFVLTFSPPLLMILQQERKKKKPFGNVGHAHTDASMSDSILPSFPPIFPPTILEPFESIPCLAAVQGHG